MRDSRDNKKVNEKLLPIEAQIYASQNKLLRMTNQMHSSIINKTDPTNIINQRADEMRNYESLLNKYKLVPENKYDLIISYYKEEQDALETAFIERVNQLEEAIQIQKNEAIQKQDKDKFITFLIIICNSIAIEGDLNKYITTFFDDKRQSIEFTEKELSFLKNTKLSDMEYSDINNSLTFKISNKNNTNDIEFSNRTSTRFELRGSNLRKELDNFKNNKKTSHMSVYDALVQIAPECKDIMLGAIDSAAKIYKMDISTDAYQQFLFKMINHIRSQELTFDEENLNDVNRFSALLDKYLLEEYSPSHSPSESSSEEEEIPNNTNQGQKKENQEYKINEENKEKKQDEIEITEAYFIEKSSMFSKGKKILAQTITNITSPSDTKKPHHPSKHGKK